MAVRNAFCKARSLEVSRRFADLNDLNVTVCLTAVVQFATGSWVPHHEMLGVAPPISIALQLSKI